jgi:uncharacterized protein with HEPN domain
MSKRTSSLLISDIIDSGQKIMTYTKGLTYEQFLVDSKTVDAVIRNFEIIGEAPQIDFQKNLRINILT